MITYYHGSAYAQLLRLHGSAAFKAILPALASSGIYFLFYFFTEVRDESNTTFLGIVRHPYPIAALVAAFTFMLTFRANFSYNRYWEAAGSIHQMQSKWMDVGTTMAAFHLQSDRYENKPPSFGAHPQLRAVVRERERLHRMTLEQLEDQMEGEDPGVLTKVCHFFKIQRKRRRSNKRRPQHPQQNQQQQQRNSSTGSFRIPTMSIHTRKLSNGSSTTPTKRKIPLPTRQTPSSLSLTKLPSQSRIDGGIDQDNPSLLLQELSHLLSLLSAVAMATLRNDIEGAESPLTEYIPGAPWPPVDPDALHWNVRKQYDEGLRTVTFLQYLFGATRSVKHRTLYNAARPFGVLGGISDAESELLQSARGPLAKVSLCSVWLQEFISREHLNGGTGKMAPPIISRLYQEVSDGMIGYNQARKVTYTPFPFPHAQITSFFTLILSIILPLLNLSFVQTNYVWFGALLNFFTVWCFVGLHEVARELECPFQNTPNDLPLATLQAQFNEALVVMYAGFNPDAFWTVPGGRGVGGSGQGLGLQKEVVQEGKEENGEGGEEEEEEEDLVEKERKAAEGG